MPDAPRLGTADMLSARSSAVRRRLGNNPKVSIDYIEACGDCFYLAMEAALCEDAGWCPVYAVSTMRDVVATSLTEEIYQLYALLHTQKTEGAHSTRESVKAWFTVLGCVRGLRGDDRVEYLHRSCHSTRIRDASMSRSPAALLQASTSWLASSRSTLCASASGCVARR